MDAWAARSRQPSSPSRAWLGCLQGFAELLLPQWGHQLLSEQAAAARVWEAVPLCWRVLPTRTQVLSSGHRERTIRCHGIAWLARHFCCCAAWQREVFCRCIPSTWHLRLCKRAPRAPGEHESPVPTCIIHESCFEPVNSRIQARLHGPIGPALLPQLQPQMHYTLAYSFVCTEHQSKQSTSKPACMHI